MPNTVRLHRVSGHEARQGLSRLHRSGRDGEVAAAQRLYLHGAPLRRESRRHIQDVVSQLHTGASHSFGGTYLELVSGERVRYTDKFDDPNLPGEMQVTVALKAVAVGTEVNIVQDGIPDAIPVEACYLGWQEFVAKPRQAGRARDQSIRGAANFMAGYAFDLFAYALRCASEHELRRTASRTMGGRRAYLNAIKSVRLKVEALSFNGSLPAFALFWFRIWCRPTAISKSVASRLASIGTTTV